jgi:hypothetical protein
VGVGSAKAIERGWDSLVRRRGDAPGAERREDGGPGDPPTR